MKMELCVVITGNVFFKYTAKGDSPYQYAFVEFVHRNGQILSVCSLSTFYPGLGDQVSTF